MRIVSIINVIIIIVLLLISVQFSVPANNTASSFHKINKVNLLCIVHVLRSPKGPLWVSVLRELRHRCLGPWGREWEGNSHLGPSHPPCAEKGMCSAWGHGERVSTPLSMPTTSCPHRVPRANVPVTSGRRQSSTHSLLDDQNL